MADSNTGDNRLAPLPDLLPGRYRHYKGGEYQVVGVARHSETLEPMVVYRPLYGEGALWVRPYAMLVEEIIHDGARCRRFAIVENGPGGPQPPRS